MRTASILWSFPVFLGVALGAAEDARAGQGVGNGGMAVVCRDSHTNRIKSARLYDFNEAEFPNVLATKREPLPIHREKTSVEKQREDAWKRLVQVDRGMDMFLTVYFHVVKFKFLPKEEVLLPTFDATLPVYGKAGCKIEQLAVTVESADKESEFEDVLVSQSIYDALPNTDKAGLYFHEALYQYARFAFQAEKSDEARRVNAILFSEGMTDLSLSLGMFQQLRETGSSLLRAYLDGTWSFEGAGGFQEGKKCRIIITSFSDERALGRKLDPNCDLFADSTFQERADQELSLYCMYSEGSVLRCEVRDSVRYGILGWFMLPTKELPAEAGATLPTSSFLIAAKKYPVTYIQNLKRENRDRESINGVRP